ncbi:extensin family protein [Qipengyuania marisflavi]|uniref:extensin family protein n=1 Tax=Qipengyuania marisflavi TaxID=2486356 RepID=UPI00319DA2A3
MTQLGQTGSRFAALPDKFYGAGCSTLNSVKLDGVGGDTAQFSVTNLGVVACPLANTFAGWARYGVDRAARQILGSPLARIETMGSYSCRNVAGTGRMSAHSRAEAIDVAGFVLADGRRISVLGNWNASAEEREFLRTIHQSACKRFGTVLGPEYNAAHRDHFHLEYGGGSFCR